MLLAKGWHMRLSSLLVLPITLFAGSFFACGGHVDVPGNGQPGPTPTGTPVPTGTPTTPGTPPTSTPTGSPTSTSTTEPVPPSPSCLRTNDHLDVVVSGALAGSCDLAKPGGPPGAPLDFIGAIDAVGVDFIRIDTCPPTADCVASLTTVSVKAAGLNLSTLPVRSLVHVTASFFLSWGCKTSIHVESVAEWDGTKNPVDIGGRTYLAGSEGSTSTAGAPFKIDLLATGCGADPGTPACDPTPAVGDYAMTFTGAGPGGSAASIPMGSSARFEANGQVLEARNLRAYYLGYCDEYWDYAYWAKASWVEE